MTLSAAFMMVCALALSATTLTAQTIIRAEYTEPTTRYAHGVLGDAIEYGALRLHMSSGPNVLIRLPQSRVFEDLAPRVQDLDGDGAAEVIVIESDQELGGSLAIYGPGGKIASTPFIGRRNRWLAPVGAADFDGDGATELAYIDRPHLAKTLRIWRYQGGELRHVVDQPGLTNHRIGEDFITSGLRTCSTGSTMVMVDAGWQRIIEVGFGPQGITQTDRGAFNGVASVRQAQAC
ncbi:FG-GAP repeat domain-containing protein [Algirhabdus cladophorae]|uniref:FG-GAP repeat domain-containing protein n=1 Tax=Algirhabdus cladophorae TaxID=3377108 RepID=UPI003B848CEB